ncbi:FG-GAP-like repeat-containing protein [Streptomyces sp. NPDC088915]|uniref:FG-GAP-like repeat-containing protein n=1 Tax=Streptomyces sp. NPDC088915 TaxID=3365912 RepID=UPI0038279D1A
MQHRPSARRVAAAVTAVLAVTAGTVLTAAPAMAAPAATTGTTATTADAADEMRLPLDAQVVSAGSTGYLTSRRNDLDDTVLEWHRYADGAILPVATGPGATAYDSNSDFAVTNREGIISVRDMRSPDTWSPSFSLGTEFKSGAKLVGVVGENLFVSVPTTEDYHELWQLARVNGVNQKRKLSSRTRNLDYKVVASNGYDLVVLGSELTKQSGGYGPSWWTARTNVLNGAVIDWEGSSGTGRWTHDSTGAYTASHRAWVQYPEDASPEIVVSGGLRVPLEGALSGAVVAGIVGDVLLYGVPGTTAGEPSSPLYARSITDPAAAPYKVLDNFTRSAQAPDGSVLVRGFTGAGDGIFRLGGGTGGARPELTLVADTGRVTALRVTGSKVPASASLEKAGTTVPMEWTLSRPGAAVDLTLTHAATGGKLVRRLSPPDSGSTFAFAWDGILNGASAPNGSYSWQITATPTDGSGGPATASGSLLVSRTANPHDFNDNGSTDVLARDAAGVLWRDDLFDWPATGGQVGVAKRTKVGPGWQTYRQIEAVGNLAGSATGDLIALDGSGVLWHYLGKNDGTFAARARIGAGWGGYKQLTGGSDLNGDGRPDLLATDASGALWYYRSLNSATTPFAARVKVGGGWGGYNQLTAVGDIAGGTAGDLVARDASGVLWLYQGKGDGTFATRVKVGGGWGGFSQLVGAGDVTGDGRPDLIAYGSGGTYVYRSTGSAAAPFTRLTTNLYAGEGTKFNSVS